MSLLRSSIGILVRVAAILWAITESTHNTLEDNPILATTEPTFTVDMKELNHVVSCSVPVPQAKETVLLIHGTGMTRVLHLTYI